MSNGEAMAGQIPLNVYKCRSVGVYIREYVALWVLRETGTKPWPHRNGGTIDSLPHSRRLESQLEKIPNIKKRRNGKWGLKKLHAFRVGATKYFGSNGNWDGFKF